MKDLEYSIHSGYAEESKVFSSTLLILDNIFNEISENYIGLYRHESRLKAVNSLIQKANEKNEILIKNNKDEISSYDELKKHIDDIIGCRLITLAPSKIVEINDIILTYKQFNIKRVKFIGDYDEYTKVTTPIRKKLEEYKEKNSLDFTIEERDSESGYFGVHYIIDFTPLQSFYKEYNIKLFSKFELQVRTLLQHTWSEIEHKCVYKGKGERKGNQLTDGFVAVANSLSGCDKTLDRFLSHNQSTLQKAPTYKLNVSVTIPQAYINFVASIEAFISEVEKSNEQFEQDKIKVEILDRFSSEVEYLNNNEKKELLSPALALAEIYLKGKFYDKAMHLYEKYVPLEEDDAWIYLRIAEVYQAQASNAVRKDQERIYFKKAFTYLNKLAHKLKEDKSEEKSIPSQCNGAALILWTLHTEEECDITECIKTAFYFSQLCLNNASQENNNVSKIDLVKYKLNYAYIFFDFIEAKKYQDPTQCQENEIKTISLELESAVNLFNEIKQAAKEEKISNEPSIHDSIGWVYHMLASQMHMLLMSPDGTFDQKAYEKISKMRWKALEHSDICIDLYMKEKNFYKNKKRRSTELWKTHNTEIMRELTDLLKKSR